MKRIIDGWLYDTEKAEVLYEYKWDDEKSTKLYKTGNGNYFFYDTQDEIIEPTCENDAVDWLGSMNDDKATDIALEEFGDYIKEA